MLPAAARHQIPAPAVAELMGNDIDVLPVAADDGGRGKGVDGVLHALKARR